MSSWREVLIRILALLQRNTLTETKNCTLKCLKSCCSVDRGEGICPPFSSPPWGIWQFKRPHPQVQEFAIQGKKNANARGSGRGVGGGGGGGQVAAGIDWCIKNYLHYFLILKTMSVFLAPKYSVISSLGHLYLRDTSIQGKQNLVPKKCSHSLCICYLCWRDTSI